uniref:Uncharacterized protein n=1 Tax=Anguilla anguilla TaxID=7936 RepID=A0A0E9X1P4_ANGAN
MLLFSFFMRFIWFWTLIFNIGSIQRFLNGFVLFLSSMGCLNAHWTRVENPVLYFLKMSIINSF